MSLESLDPIQLEAVKSDERDILCDSKAGSGKTRILMNRCLWLLENGTKPEEIMLVTFTNKAANEMMSRIRKLSPDGDKILCGTFHYLAMKYIREYADILGYDSNFNILSPDDAEKMMRDTIKTYDLLHPEKDVTGITVLKPKALVRLFSASRNLSIPFENYLVDNCNFTFGQAETAEEIINYFSAVKIANNVLDFDDLLENFKNLLVDTSINEEILGGFKYIMVDEYQDINKTQNSIIFFLRGMTRDLFVVGDPYQCIYGFRGSKIEYIRDFEENYGAAVFQVKNNYRSTQPILDAAAEATNGLASMKSMIIGNERPVIKLCKDNYEQADIIARQVKKFITEGEAPDQIAVLVRTTFAVNLIEQSFKKFNISYAMRAGYSYFEKAHIKDILMVLMTLVNPKNGDALKRVLGLFDGFGPKTIDTCVKYVQDNNLNIYALLKSIEDGSIKVSKKAKEGAESIKVAYSGINTCSSISAKIERLITNFYSNYLLKIYPDDYDERIAEVKGLVELSKKYTDMQLFINESIADSDVNNKESGEEKGPKVIISTIHRAKGLEWDNCIICNMDNEFSNVGSGDEQEFKIPESQRLLYVAITRARKRLLITANRQSYQQFKKYRSNFVHLLHKLKSCRIV